MDRQAISVRTRFEIFKSDAFICQYCGRRPPDVVLQVDHIVAVANGGTNDRLNLTTSCWACNAGKSSVPLNSVTAPAIVDVDLERERLAQRKALQEFLLEQKVEEDNRLKLAMDYWKARDFSDVGFTATRREEALRRFIPQIPLADILRFIDLAKLKRLYPGQELKYFCACCWREVGPQR